MSSSKRFQTATSKDESNKKSDGKGLHIPHALGKLFGGSNSTARSEKKGAGKQTKGPSDGFAVNPDGNPTRGFESDTVARTHHGRRNCPEVNPSNSPEPRYPQARDDGNPVQHRWLKRKTSKTDYSKKLEEVRKASQAESPRHSGEEEERSWQTLQLQLTQLALDGKHGRGRNPGEASKQLESRFSWRSSATSESETSNNN